MRSNIRSLGVRLVILSLTFTLIGCGGVGVDSGRLENGVYTNDYFDFSMSIPDSWTVLDKEAIDSLMELTQDRLGESLEKGAEKCFYILFFGGGFDKERGFDYSLSVNALLANGEPELNDPYSYLQERCYGELESLYGNQLMAEPVFEKSIDGRVFYGKTFSIISPNAESFSQTMVVLFSNGYLLSFIMTYNNEAELEEMMESTISTIEFQK